MSDKWQAGYDLMNRMMGPEFAKALEANARSGVWGADIARMAVENAFGDTWARPGLPLKTRSIIVISMLIATGHHAELKNHLRFGINNGLTAGDIQEILIQAIPYLGFPAVSQGINAAIEVFRERGIEPNVKTSEERGVL